MAYLLIGGCVAVVVLFVAMWVLAGIALRNDPWLEADIRIWQAAYDDLAVLPEPIADMLHDRDLLGLRKAGDDVFFITSGAVDDEWGYVISGDSAVCMDGLWCLNRVAGHVYSFSTMKSKMMASSC